MTTLEEKLGYQFQNRELLENALTHSSCANESRGRLSSNERLEFLGDSVLSVVVADYLFHQSGRPEGVTAAGTDCLPRSRLPVLCPLSANRWNWTANTI